MAGLFGTALVALLAVLLNATAARAQTDCENQASIVRLERQPDVATFAPGTEFTATWIMENTGSCTWTATYRVALVRDGGVTSARAYQLRSSVQPGETYAISVDLVAPSEGGEYAPSWRLQGTDGAYFGPPLDLELSVAGAPTGAQDAVELPAILAYGGVGFAFEPDPCLPEGGSLDGEGHDVPSLVLQHAEPTQNAVALCGFPARSAVELTLSDPDGVEYTRTIAIGEPVEFFGDTGSYTRTAVIVRVGWHPALPRGVWQLAAEGEGTAASLELEASGGLLGKDGPAVVNWPAAPANPLDGPTCPSPDDGFAYAPGEPMVIAAAGFPAQSLVKVGVYVERYNQFYLAASDEAMAGDDGALEVTLDAPAETLPYYVIAAHTLDPQNFGPMGLDKSVYGIGLAFDPIGDGISAEGCFRVADPNAAPMRFALIDENAYGTSLVIDDEIGSMDRFAFAPTGAANCIFGAPTWEGDNASIVFNASCDGPADLYRFSLDGAAEALTETDRWSEIEPSAAQDGRIVFARVPVSMTKGGAGADGVGELAILEPASGEVTGLGVDGRTPKWSPDASHIAYASDVSGSWQVYLLEVESGDTRLLSRGCRSHCRHPAWSPDGESILYSVSRTRDDFASVGLWRVPVAGGQPRAWLKGPFDRPAWSDTGWVFVEGPQGIYRMRTEERRGAPELYLFEASGDATHYRAPAPSH